MKQQLFPLYFVVFLAFFGFGITIPTFTSMLIQPTDPEISLLSFGQRTSLLGLLIASFPIGQFFGGSILGTFSDQFGRKKVLLASLVFATLCYLGVAYSMWHIHLPFLFLTLFVTGFFSANVVITQNVIADHYPLQDRTTRFGYVYACSSLGYLVGPPIGGILSNSSIVSWFGYWTPFVLVSALLGLTVLWVAAFFEETLEQKKGGPLLRLEAFTHLKDVFLDQKLRFFYFINGLLYFSIYGYYRSYLMYISKTFSVDNTLLCCIVSYAGLPIVLFNFLWMRGLSKRFSPFSLTAWSAPLMGILFCLVPLFPSINSLWITLFLASSFVAVCITGCSTLISTKAPEEKQGRVMGNNLSIQGGMTALSALAGGVIAILGVDLPLITFGTVGVLAGGILFFRGRDHDKGLG